MVKQNNQVLTKIERRRRDSGLCVVDIPLRLIKDNPFQPRKKYPKKGLKLLAKSISERGLLQPISVVKLKDKYVIVGGHRRTRAFRILHRKTIPVIVRKKSTNKDLALDLAIENALRKDFTPAEKAQAIFTVLSTIGNVDNDVLRAYSLVTQVKLMSKRGEEKVKNLKGNSIGFTPSDIFQGQRLLLLLGTAENTALKYLRLLSLPAILQDKIIAINSNESLSNRRVSEGYITVSMAYEISRIKNNRSRRLLYKQTISEGWNCLQLRHVVDELIETGKEDQINKLGSSKRRGEDDHGISSLTKKCFNLSNSLWNFRKKVQIIPFSIKKVIWRASLKKLKKSCVTLIEHIDDTLKDNKGIFEITDLNETIEVVLGKGKGKDALRFTFPRKKGRELKLNAGDKLIILVKEIKRNSKGFDS